VSAPRSIFASKLAAFPELVFSDAAAFERHGQWEDFFRHRIGASFDGRVVFEVGCNDAEFLTRIAVNHPRVAFVGLDWKFKAIHGAATRVTQVGLNNVCLVRGRAQDVARIFGDGEVDEVWVFHPDPCDKPNELKTRLIAEPFLMDVHRVLRDGHSTLTLKTDHGGYFQWTLALLGLPEPEAFDNARLGLAPAPGAPRVRARDLMQLPELPPQSEAVRKGFACVAWSNDFWNDQAMAAHVAGRMFDGEQTAFEGRFAKKRLPIYFVELRKHLAATPPPTPVQRGGSGGYPAPAATLKQ
jgi:tRNA G46 methylase TrmB